MLNNYYVLVYRVHIIFSPSEDDSNKQKDQPIIQKKELAEVEKLRRQHPDIFEEVLLL